MQSSLSPRRTPRIVVDQPVALYDAPTAIALEGFVPGAPVTVNATFQIPGAGRWGSNATFVADGAGRVDLTRDAPAAGTYGGVSAMGLFWSAAPLPGEPPALAYSVTLPLVVRLETEASGSPRVELTLERRLAGPGVTRLPVREAGVVGTLFMPAGEGPHPAVIVLGGSDGGISEHRSALAASHGYAALSLAYFRAPGIPQELVNIPLEYFENAIRWMRGQPWLRDGFLAVWGASRRAVANWPCCSGRRFRQSMPSSPMSPAVSSTAPSNHTTHPMFQHAGVRAGGRCHTSRSTTTPTIRPRWTTVNHLSLNHHATSRSFVT
jgi:hypothetical protein